jgi:hypothetical protein
LIKSNTKLEAINELILDFLLFNKLPIIKKVKTKTLLNTEAEAPVSKEKTHSKGSVIPIASNFDIRLLATVLVSKSNK